MHLIVINPVEDRQEPRFAAPSCQEVFEMYESYYPTIGYHPPWVGYFVVEGNQVMGTCGFTGPPNNGQVELAYWTFSEFEGRGVASAACAALIEIATNADGAILITAKTAPEHNASTRILEKNGFTFSGIVPDHEIGDAWLWKRMNGH